MTAVGSGAGSLGGYIMGALASLFQATYTVQMKATLNSFQQDADTLIPSPKTNTAYERVSSDSPETSSRGSPTTPEAEASTTATTRGAYTPSTCTTILVETPLGSSAFGEDNSQRDNLHIEEGIAAAQDECINNPVKDQAVKQEPTGETNIQDTVGNAESLDLKAPNVSLELDGRNRVGGDKQDRTGVVNSSPRAEPICMFYNMLNAFCLFPIVILLSDEPQVLWKLATEQSALTASVLAEVIGIGTSWNYYQSMNKKACIRDGYPELVLKVE